MKNEKPGRPPLDAPIMDRIMWSLWQSYAHVPEEAEARRIHDLIKEINQTRLRQDVRLLHAMKQNYPLTYYFRLQWKYWKRKLFA